MKFVADLHTHTIASTHAYSTVTENTAEAHRVGLKIMAVTDHGPMMEDTPHIWHHLNYASIPRVINDVFVVRGIEANIIDNKGALDIDTEFYDRLEWIIASYHWGGGTKNEVTESYIRLSQNPRVCCLGHTDSPSFEYDIREVCKACHDNETAIELNVARIRDEKKVKAREFYKKLLSVCAEEKTFVVVNTDSHFWSAIGDFEPAVKLISQTGFPEELLLNADEERLKRFITQKKGVNIFE